MNISYIVTLCNVAFRLDIVSKFSAKNSLVPMEDLFNLSNMRIPNQVEETALKLTRRQDTFHKRNLPLPAKKHKLDKHRLQGSGEMKRMIDNSRCKFFRLISHKSLLEPRAPHYHNPLSK